MRQEHRDSNLKQNSPRAVIGKDLLEKYGQIWHDPCFPAGFNRTPKVGIPATGKLSADEYKVVCSISLVITLIRARMEYPVFERINHLLQDMKKNGHLDIEEALAVLQDIEREDHRARRAQQLDGVALGRVIYSCKPRESSVGFAAKGHTSWNDQQIIRHTHLTPSRRNRSQTATRRTLTVPLGDVISHFVRTDLTLLIKENAVTHVYPVPKIFRDNASGMPIPQ
ncbi:hypothetical protein C8R42DRAFT_642765 [Lentinula raphanica]|nr:hypothetical protein C8R42DRAFT_642765 [Lentinula raphanica]